VFPSLGAIREHVVGGYTSFKFKYDPRELNIVRLFLEHAQIGLEGGVSSLWFLGVNGCLKFVVNGYLIEKHSASLNEQRRS